MSNPFDLFGDFVVKMFLPLGRCSGPDAEHQGWLPQTAAAATRAPEEETEGGACIDTEVADELRRLNQKIRKLEYQA